MHTSPPAAGYLGIDLGKSAARIRFQPEGAPPSDTLGPGFNIAAHRDPVGGMLTVLISGLPRLAQPPRRCLAAITGAPADEDGRRRLLDGLAAATGASQVACCPDYIAAHAGALARPGVLIIAGTGAIAVALDPDGHTTRVDGWGPHLGDDGGAYAIGRAGLRAAFAAQDGRGPATTLHERAREELGTVDYPAAYRLHTDPDAVAAVAAFAQRVAEEVRRGDDVARTIWAAAVADLARTTARAAELTGSTVASYAGRLFGCGDLLIEPLRTLLAAAGVRLCPPAGSPLDGAIQLCGPLGDRYRDQLTATAAWTAGR